MFARNRPYYRIAKANVPAPARHPAVKIFPADMKSLETGPFPCGDNDKDHGMR